MNLTVFNIANIIFSAVFTSIYYLIVFFANKYPRIRWGFIICGVIAGGLTGGIEVPSWSEKIAQVLITTLVVWLFSLLARLPKEKNQKLY
jgi:hypothetical protein